MAGAQNPQTTSASANNTEANMAYINNEPYKIEKGETILSFLKRYKGEDSVPTLCDAPNLDPFGACRVCSVDVGMHGNGGTIKTVASCHTPITPGMMIFPDSKNVKRLRKNIIELVPNAQAIRERAAKASREYKRYYHGWLHLKLN